MLEQKVHLLRWQLRRSTQAAAEPDRLALLQRVLWLGVLVIGGVSVYLVAMLLLGFRLRDLREH